MADIIRLEGDIVTQSFEEWQQQINDDFGVKNVYYREVGESGWSTLNVIDGKPILVPHKGGPHWVDAVPTKQNPLVRSGKLLGTYYKNLGNGKRFFSVQK